MRHPWQERKILPHRAQLDTLLTRDSGTNDEDSFKRARVLHVLTRIAGGGAEDNTLYTCSGVAASGFEVDLALGEENEPASIRKTGIDPSVRVFIIGGLRRNPSPFNELRAIAELRTLIRSRGYHIVHSHGSKAGIIARFAAEKERVPLVFHGVHGISFSPLMGTLQRTLYRALERWAARRTTAFVCVGEDMKTKYVAAGIGEPNMYSVIHSGMDLDLFKRAGEMTADATARVRASFGIAPDAIVVGMISRMEARKQHELFLQSIQELIRSENPTTSRPISVLLVGDGPREVELRALVDTLDLTSIVTFTGYRNDVEQMFAISDIVALTSKWEGLPRVLVQAAAVGRPVVTFDVDGVWEIVEDGETGYVVPQGDVSSFADRLGELVRQSDIRTRMGETARSKVNESWTIEAMVRDTVALYRRFLERDET
jgi:glycosyltransferase involved in cell wall biosynthesis